MMELSNKEEAAEKKKKPFERAQMPEHTKRIKNMKKKYQRLEYPVPIHDPPYTHLTVRNRTNPNLNIWNNFLVVLLLCSLFVLFKTQQPLTLSPGISPIGIN